MHADCLVSLSSTKPVFMKTSLALLFICLTNCCFSQNTFVKRIETKLYNYGDIVSASNGDYMIIHPVRQTDTSTNSDLYITRLTKNGRTIWEKYYKYPLRLSESYLKVLATSDNGLLVFTSTYDLTTKIHSGIIIKTDSFGVISWTKNVFTTTGAFEIKPDDLIESTTGKYILMYNLRNTEDIFDDEKLQITKLNYSGDIISQIGLANLYEPRVDQNFQPMSILERVDGGYTITLSYDCAECQNGPNSYLLNISGKGNIISYSKFNPVHHNYYDYDYPFTIVKNKKDYSMFGYLETWNNVESKYYYYCMSIDVNGQPTHCTLIPYNLFALQKFLRSNNLILPKIQRSLFTKNYELINYTYFNKGRYGPTEGILVGKYDSIGRICSDFSRPRFDTSITTIDPYAGQQIIGATIFVDTLVSNNIAIAARDVDFSRTNCLGKAPGRVSRSLASQEIILNTRTIKVLPNPASNFITVSWTSFQTATIEINIVGVDGRLLKVVKANTVNGNNSTTIDISSLMRGTYFLKIISGNSTQVQKFVKE